MRKFLLTTYLLASISLSSPGQPFDTTLRIKTFIKIWGLLKYHHPTIASGKLDWDSVFIANLPRVSKAKGTTEFSNIMSDILIVTGKSLPGKMKNVGDSLFMLNKVSIDWVRTSKVLNNTVKQELLNVNNYPGPDTNKYIKIVHYTSDFSGENKFEHIAFPDINYRLLFLSRFWNIINYFAPYKHLTTNWDNVLETYIPKIIHSNDSLSYYKTLQELSKSLNDGHSQLALNGQMLSDLFFGHYTPPFYCQIVEEKVVVRNVGNDSIAKTLDIMQGDIITKVDGEEIGKIIKSRKKYISASNEADENHQLSRYILDGESQNATLEIRRGDKILVTTIKRVSTSNRNWGPFINYTSNDVGYKKINDSVLLIYAMQIWDGNLDTIKQLVKKSNAVIFDVRNYPGNDAFFYIADPFLSEPKVIDYSIIAVPESPGLFKWKLNPNKIGQKNDNAFRGMVIILCDVRTQSQGEYSCMVLQTIPGAVTIGSQTAGADGVVTNIPMGGGLSISYSGYGVYYPDKTQTQRVGVKIDIPVKRTIAAIQNNKDEILERALQYINTNK